jgi:DNA-binding response OmpR family regulator
MRRASAKRASEPSVLEYGPLTLDLDARIIHARGRSHHLTPKECRLLATFMLHPGQVLTRHFLMKEVWDTDFVADTRTLEVHVHWLRRKIDPDRRAHGLIHTVRGVGYVLRQVQRETEEPERSD